MRLKLASWSLLNVRVDLLCLLPMLLGCGLFLTCAVCLLLSCKPCLLRLPASRVRLLAVLASFDTLLVELLRTLAPRDERHSGQNDDHCNDNQNDRGGTSYRLSLLGCRAESMDIPGALRP